MAIRYGNGKPIVRLYDGDTVVVYIDFDSFPTVGFDGPFFERVDYDNFELQSGELITVTTGKYRIRVKLFFREMDVSEGLSDYVVQILSWVGPGKRITVDFFRDGTEYEVILGKSFDIEKEPDSSAWVMIKGEIEFISKYVVDIV